MFVNKIIKYATASYGEDAQMCATDTHTHRERERERESKKYAHKHKILVRFHTSDEP